MKDVYKIPNNLPEKVVLKSRYFYQYDSQTSEGYRMCSASSHAGALWMVKPNALSNSANADDEYFIRMKHYGDTTDGNAHEQCLRQFFKVDARFRTDLLWSDLVESVMRGQSVPVGTVHHGHYTNPVGGGHFMNFIGWDKTEGRDDLIFHDPAGKMDIVNGGYIYGSGKFVRYARKYWMERWQVKGTLGWGTIIKGLL